MWILREQEDCKYDKQEETDNDENEDYYNNVDKDEHEQ